MTTKKTPATKPLATPLLCPFCGKAFLSHGLFYSHTHTTGGTK